MPLIQTQNKEEQMNPDLLTTSEAAQYLRLSSRTLYEWAERGLLAHYKISNRLRFSTADLDALLARNRQEPWDVAR